MANSELKALIKIQGDGTGAVKEMQRISVAAKALGANVIKVSEQVNTALDRRIARTQQNIAALELKARAIIKSEQAAQGRIAANTRQKGALDPKLAGSVQAITKANQAYIKSEQELSRAITERKQALISGTAAQYGYESAVKALAQAESYLSQVSRDKKATDQQIEAAENAVERATKNLTLAEAKLSVARIKSEDIEKRISILENTRARRLQELNTAQGQAGVQTQKLATAQYKLEEATKKQLQAQDRLARADKAAQFNASIKNTKELERAKTALVKADASLARAEDNYQKELTTTNQMQAKSTQLGEAIEADKKQLIALDKEKAQTQKQLNAEEEKLLSLEEKAFNVTLKSTNSNRQSNTELAKGVELFRKAGNQYLQAGRQFAQAGQQVVIVGREYARGFRDVYRAIQQQRAEMQKLNLMYRNAQGNWRVNTALLTAMGRALVSTAKAFGAITLGTTLAIAGLARFAGSMRGVMQSMGRMSSVARGLGQHFTTTGAHIGGIAVRLNAVQMGLFAAGGALTTFGMKGKQVFGDLLKTAGDFQQQLVTITATLGRSGKAWAGEIRNEAIRLGEKTMFDPNEAAQVMTDLIRGGVTAESVVNGTAEAVLNLAQATGEDLDTATKAVITSTSQWANQNLTAKESVDDLTRAANASASTVNQLAEGEKNLGGIASVLGVSHQDTLAMLGALANVGLRGGQGGTALRYFLLQLIPSTQKQIELMKELGLMTFNLGKDQEYLGKSMNVQAMSQEQLIQAIWEKWSGTKRLFQEAIDQEDPAVSRFQTWAARQGLITSAFIDQKTGELKDASVVMQTLWDKFGSLTPEARGIYARQIFGERGGSKGAVNLLNAFQQNLKQYQSGAKDSKGTPLSLDANVITAITKEMSGLGSAQEIAQQRVQTFSGAVERLGSTLQALKIAIGEPLMQPLAALLNKFSDFISATRVFLEERPELTKTLGTIGLVATAIAAVAGPLTLLSAAFPYIMAGIRGVMLAMAPMTVMFLAISGIIAGFVVLFTDPQFGLTGVIEKLGATAQPILDNLGKIFQVVLSDIIIPLAYAVALVLSEYVVPAVEQFAAAFSGGQILSGVEQFAGFFQDTIIPAFLDFAEFLAIHIPDAIAVLVTVWNSVLVPVFQGAVEFWNTTLFPVLAALAGWFMAVIPDAISILAAIWTGVLEPIFTTVGHIIVDTLLPILGQLFHWLGEVIPQVTSFVGHVWETILGPAIEKIIHLFGMLLPPIMNVVGVVISFLLPVFQVILDIAGPIFTTLLDIITWVFDKIGGAFKWLGDTIGGFFEWLGIKSHDGAQTAGDNFKTELDKQLGQANENTKTQVQNLGGKFQALEKPAGISGYTSGYNYSGGILDGLNANISKIQSTIASLRRSMGEAEEMATGQIDPSMYAGTSAADWGMGLQDMQRWLDEHPDDASAKAKAGRLLLERSRQLAEAEAALQAEQKAPFNPSGIQFSGAGGIPFPEGSDTGGGTPYDQQTDNRGGPGGGGGGGNTRTAAEAAADEAKKVFDAIKAGIEAFRKIAQLSVPSNLDAKMNEFAAATAMIVKKMADIARAYIDGKGETPLLDAASKFAETGGRAMDLIIKGIEAFQKLKDFTAPAIESINLFLAAVTYVQGKVTSIAETYTADQMTNAQLFSESATKSMDMLDKGLDAFSKVGKFVRPAEERLDMLIETIKMTVQKVSGIASSLAPEMQEAAAVYSENAAKMVDAIGKVAELVGTLNDPKLNLAPVEDKVKSLANQMLAMMNYVGDLWTKNPGWTPENAAKVATLAESAAKVSSGLSGVMTMMQAISEDKGKTNIPNLASKVRELSDAMLAMMNYLGPLSAPWEGFSEIPAKFTEDGGKVAAGLKALMELFATLNDKENRRVEPRNLAARVEELANALAHMANAVKTAIGTNPDISSISDYVEVAGKAGEALTKLVELFKAIGEKGFKTVSEGTITDLVNQMVAITHDFSEALKEAKVSLDEDGVEILKSQADIADSISKITDALGSTLELLQKAGEFKKGKANTSQVIADVLSFMTDFTKQFAAARAEFIKNVDAETAQLAEQSGGIVSSLGGALDTFEKLSSFKGVAQGRIASFVETMKQTVAAMKPLVEEVAPEMLDLAKDFGEKLGPAFELFANAMSFFTSLTGEATTEEGKTTLKGGLRPIDPDAIGEFTGKLLLLIEKLRSDLLTKVGPEMLDLAQEFAEKFGPAVQTLNDALDFFLKIQKDEKGEGGLKPIDPDAIGAVVGSMYIMMNHWRNLITGNNGEFQTPEFAAKSENFRSVATTVLDSLNEILDLATRVAQANEAGAIDNLPALIQKLVDTLRTATQLQLPATMGDVKREFAAMFGDTEDEFDRRLDPTIEGTIANQWYGKTPGKSFLYSMWYGVEGKGGLRPVLRLAFEGLFQDLSGVFETWGPPLVKFWESVMNQLKSLTTNALNEIRTALTSFTAGSISVTVTVQGMDVPKLAEGAIVTKPTLAVIGEGHNAEAVVPLNKQNAGMFGSTTNNYYNVRQANVNRITDMTQQSRRARRLQNDLS